MSPPRFRTVFFAAFLSLLLWRLADASDGLPKPASVRAEFELALKLGDSSEKIEAYLERRSLEFDFDPYQHRYQSTMRGRESKFHVISIYVNVDGDKRFRSVEAFDSYTMP